MQNIQIGTELNVHHDQTIEGNHSLQASILGFQQTLNEFKLHTLSSLSASSSPCRAIWLGAVLQHSWGWLDWQAQTQDVS